MTIPITSNYPDELDTEQNLFLVHDSLRLRLTEDYNPGDISITVEENPSIMDKFPSTGLITLTEQCSEIDERALSFFYTSKTSTTFDGLQLLPEFNDVAKPKRLTNVTQNVMALHHNSIKNAVIAIEEFIGIKGTIDTSPFGDTLEGRVNFLRKLVLTPRAWFTVDKRLGLVPLTVTFKDESFRLGSGTVTYIWDFGDQTNVSLISAISTISIVPDDAQNVIVYDLDGGTITKTFNRLGNFSVKLTVINEFGQDTVTFNNLINARIGAPEEAIINFIPKTNQILTAGTPTGGPYTTPPKIRAAVNDFIEIEVPDGENPYNDGVSYGGELLNGSGNPLDPIETYTWSLGDDLVHNTISTTKALYEIGGLYDVRLRVDTESHAYRITTYRNAIDIVEKYNLWLWTFSDSSTVKSNEFGLISETFKTSSTSLTVARDSSFLDGTNNEDQAKREFKRNAVFMPRGTTASGNLGNNLLLWASGGTAITPLINHSVKNVQYSGFSDTYSTLSSITGRPWNWAFLGSPSISYFVFGQNPTAAANTNPSFQTKTSLNLTNLTTSSTSLNSTNYSNGADELQEHVSIYDSFGAPTNGYFAVYRTAWKNRTGYILRNDGVGTFFRLKSFYKTEGIISNPFINITKLTDIAGTTKLEGQLVTLANGIFFFNNSGSISAYNDTTGTWETGGPSVNSASFRNVQDSSISDFDNVENTLLATSNGDRLAYLSFDYSTNAFIKFNGLDLSFSKLSSRPSGEQWIMGVY